MVVEKMAGYAQAAAVMTSCNAADEAAAKIDCGWEVSNIEVRFSHGGGIHNSNGARILNSSVHHNGQSGLGGNNGIVDGVEVEKKQQSGRVFLRVGGRRREMGEPPTQACDPELLCAPQPRRRALGRRGQHQHAVPEQHFAQQCRRRNLPRDLV
jgi:hypothetical protein